jgi:3-oxoacyl-(acyl-carrier-protein) synthase
MNRVVVTGLGVLSPIGHGLLAFERGLREGRSGIRFRPELAALGFRCQVAGVPEDIEELGEQYFDQVTLLGMDRYSVIGCIAGLDCWDDAGLSRQPVSETDWDTSVAFGSALGGLETAGKTLIPTMDAGQVRRLGSAIPERVMWSSASARLGGLLGVGGQVTSNSSACGTGTEAIANGYWMIRHGRAARVLAGGCEGDSPYLWAGFDAMRVLCRNFNQAPERAARPMSASAAGFVPAAGAGAVMLENLESALARGARIYAEVAGAAANCGGQRNGGTMTFGNPEGVRRCIRAAIADATIEPEDIDLISGHLTSTAGDTFEANNWRCALQLPAGKFPLLNAPKSLFGHALGAAGAIECVAAILQLHRGFVHPALNCEDLHPELAWCSGSIVRECLERRLRVVAKASFGFGDVNTCVLFREYIR